MNNLPIWDVPLRQWQQKAYSHIQARFKDALVDPAYYMLSAFPGSGKTYMALRIAHDWLSRNINNRVVVLVPKSKNGLPRQFRVEALNFGIRLTSKINTKELDLDKAIAPDRHGIVATYSKLTFSSEWFAAYCRRYNVLVIGDECHHIAGEDVDGEVLAWGDAFIYSFSDACAVLMMTGTAWRSDNHQIPFTRYDDNGELIVDFSFTYRDALEQTERARLPHERIARQIHFLTMGGFAEYSEDLETKWMNVTPDISRRDISPVLRTIYDVDTNPAWFKKTFYDADNKLIGIRNSVDYPYPDAAGLIIAPDKDNAIKYGELIYEWTGDRPLVVHYEETDSSKLIEQFRENENNEMPRWIISINMISEGVDIPRLNVLIYCSYVRQKLYFYQAIGRVLRWDKYGPARQIATVYMPFINPLTEYAQSIKDDIAHVLGKKGPEGPGPGEGRMIVSIDSGHDFGDFVDTQDDETIEANFMQLATEVWASTNIPHGRDYFAKALVRLHKSGRINITQEIELSGSDEPKRVDPDDMETDNDIVNKLVGRVRHAFFPSGQHLNGAAYAAINGYLMKIIARGRDQWTPTDYTDAQTMLKRWLDTGVIPMELELWFTRRLNK